MTHLAGIPALWPSKDVAHSTSVLGTKEGLSCVHIVCSSSLLGKKKKKKEKPQEENWPQVACSFPAPEMITEYSSADGHSGTYRGKPLRFKPSVDTTSRVALGES